MTLETQNLQVAVNGKRILQDVSVKFPAGKRTAIIGPNGAGKSTLLKAIAALNRDIEGRILLDGRNIESFGRKELARKMAILPQGTLAPADVTVENLVEYGRFPYRSFFMQDREADQKAVKWAMDVAQIAGFATRRVQDLSGGERQRVFLAMVLAQQPQILLLDEPTTYLDIANQLQVMEIVRTLYLEQQITVIMVLHDINHALQYADEIVVMQGGRVRSQGRPKEVLTVDCLRDTFGVEADVFVNDRGQEILFPLRKVK